MLRRTAVLKVHPFCEGFHQSAAAPASYCFLTWVQSSFLNYAGFLHLQPQWKFWQLKWEWVVRKLKFHKDKGRKSWSWGSWVWWCSIWYPGCCHCSTSAQALLLCAFIPPPFVSLSLFMALQAEIVSYCTCKELHKWSHILREHQHIIL